MVSKPSLQVSVAMCTFNGARFIEEQLWSIFRQTLLPQEIVVSDDGSSDETLNLVEKTYAEASNTITGVSEVVLKIIRNPAPLGVTKNFEQAIAHCSQELIALCDQDDVWIPQRLEKMVGEFNRRPALILLHHDSELVDVTLKSKGNSTFGVLNFNSWEQAQVKEGNAIDVLIRRNVVTGATTIFKHKLFIEALPFPKNWLHDEWLAIIASSLGEVDFLKDQLILYRQHSNNVVGASRKNIKYLIGRTLFPRSKRNRLLYNRAQELFDFSNKSGSSSKLIELSSKKYLHEKFRYSLASSRFKRVIPVIRELRSGNYHKYGLGVQDAIRDVLQSPK